MVSGFVSKIGKGKIIFIEENTKVNAKVYQETLKKHLPLIRKLSGTRKNTLQDGARNHTAQSTINFLENSVPDYIEKECWPANSCNLNPLDYGIWGIMENSAYGKRKRYDNIDELKAGVRNAWKEIKQVTINKIIDQWRNRLQQAVENNGGHIEQYH